MLRSVFCTAALAAALQVSALEAQAPAGWGDELTSPLLPPVNSLPGASQAQGWPAPPLVDSPKPLRAVYLNAWAFGGRHFDELVKLADTTEINAFVIDVKDDTGYLTYRSAVPTAAEIGANDQRRTRDAERRLRLLSEHGIYPIARIVVAKDPLLAARKPAWSVQHVNGGLWRDRLNFAWVDAFNDSVWIYAAQLAEEAIRLGFAEVQYDYVRFPDEPREAMAQAIFPARRTGETQRAAVRASVAMLKHRLEPLGVPVTFDIFGLTASATSGDLG